MTREEVEKLKKLSVEVAEAHNKHGGLCGLNPYADLESGNLNTPCVHLIEEEFLGTFKKFETESRIDGGHNLCVFEDGVKIFTIAKEGVE